MTRTSSLPRRVLLLALMAVVAVAGCGGDDDNGGSSGELKVFADARLEPALSTYAKDFPGAEVRFTFGEPAELAGRLRKQQGADVFVSADSVEPDALWSENRTDGPVVFAANRLVLAVPAGSKIGSLEDAAKQGVTLAMGPEGSPLGRYTRQALGKLGATGLDVLANVEYESTQMSAIVEKVRSGEVDGGIVYHTETGDLTQIEVEGGSGALGEAAILLKTKNRKGAEAFIEGLVSSAGQDALKQAGFLPATQQ